MIKILSALIIILAVGVAPQTDKGNIYPCTMTVTRIDTESDTVTLTASSGHIYSFYGIEDWQINDICSCIMNDNGTETIEDDMIVDTKYSGHKNNVSAANGRLEWLDGDEWYQFASYDNTVLWALTTDDIGFVPESDKTYTLIYHDNGTDDIYDDIFIAIAERYMMQK